VSGLSGTQARGQGEEDLEEVRWQPIHHTQDKTSWQQQTSQTEGGICVFFDLVSDNYVIEISRK
jgi:hypothetical protein